MTEKINITFTPEELEQYFRLQAQADGFLNRLIVMKKLKIFEEQGKVRT